MAEQPTRRRRQAPAKTRKDVVAETTPAKPPVTLEELESVIAPELATPSEPVISDEVRELMEAQQDQAQSIAPPAQSASSVIHPVGTMDAAALVGDPTILAPRSNASSATSGRKVKLKGPKNPGDNPIAVVSKDGSVYPFSGAVADRVALLGYDVTYIYDIDDAKMVLAHNERELRAGNADRVIHGIPMEAPPLPNRDDAATLRENLAVAFSPDMIKG